MLAVLVAALTALTSTPASALPTSAGAAAAPDAATAPVTVPALSGWKPAEGAFQLTRRSRVLVDPRATAVHDEARTFADDIAAETGRRPPVVHSTTAAKAGDIVLRLDDSRADLGAEGYALTVGGVATVTAKTDAGAFYGTRTLLQMFRAGAAVPAGSTVDVPQYAERGVGVCACVINVSTSWLERLVKDAAYLKLNQLWLELKVKSTAHPESNEWGYYTEAQIAALQRLAHRYHVTLVPEVNSPGHIEPWIRNRPDLQLTDSSGQKQVSRLDITKPEAFTFLTQIIDEYFTVFDTPYWHMGADEYMIGSDYARYPQMAAYAKEKFGPDAVPQDAFVDFVNRIDDYVKAKGKTLRIWNDGITTAAKVPLNTDIVVEHWYSYGLKPSRLLAQGRRLMNASNDLYHVRGAYGVNTRKLYDDGWDPRHFLGETVPSADGITGAKMTMWPDNGSGNTENEVESDVFAPLRLVAQVTWGRPKPDPDYAAFTGRVNAVGRAPGFGNVDRTPVEPGTYTLARGDAFLSAATAAEGASLATGTAESAWDVSTTADGYYTLRNAAAGRCAESRIGTRYLNTPLQPGTPITAQTCDPGNRLQRWQATAVDGGVTLTNAITRMVAVLDDGGRLVQQVPDGHRAAVFTLAPALKVAAAADQATVVPGGTTTLTVTVTNGTGEPASSVEARPTAPAGWTVTPGSATAATIAPGATWTASFTATPPRQAQAGTTSLGAAVGYTVGGVHHSVAAAAQVRLSCATAPTRPAAVTYADSEETAGENGRAANAIDGNPATYWHTEWSRNAPRPPHEIRLDLGSAKSVCAITYLPRQGSGGGSANGRIGDYEIYLSTDGSSWGDPVAKGAFPDTAEAHWVPVPATTARYLRLVELSEVNGNPWAAVAEVGVDATAAP
ncbi:lacto-N-biosidase [Streptosporangium pseudovulgare]|uniref:Lacto-N-biosidase n=1 Tax=Streptosporangium pseudovulgare TaxID=35765 RepID=A0ABQ2QM00_9ACTN|nr:lacto-N-biosidase [Streptosporangium pseudovulgare]